jgi:hypothetical protein
MMVAMEIIILGIGPINGGLASRATMSCETCCRGAGEGVVHHLNQPFAIQQLSGMVVAAGMAGQLKMVMIGHWHWWWVDWC